MSFQRCYISIVVILLINQHFYKYDAPISISLQNVIKLEIIPLRKLVFRTFQDSCEENYSYTTKLSNKYNDREEILTFDLDLEKKSENLDK